MSAAPTQRAQTFELYHGTSWENAQNILREGFKESSGGCLGRGIYVGREEKATRFAQNCERHGGAQGGLVRCRITVSNPKYVKSDDPQGNWRTQGHDAVRTDKTTMSNGPEWCLRDPRQIEVVGIHRVPISADPPDTNPPPPMNEWIESGPLPSSSSPGSSRSACISSPIASGSHSHSTPTTQHAPSQQAGPSRENPSVITGWEHSPYAMAQTPYARKRYSYLGKDEDSGEPEWLDYGPVNQRERVTSGIIEHVPTVFEDDDNDDDDDYSGGGGDNEEDEDGGDPYGDPYAGFEETDEPGVVMCDDETWDALPGEGTEMDDHDDDDQGGGDDGDDDGEGGNGDDGGDDDGGDYDGGDYDDQGGGDYDDDGGYSDGGGYSGGGGYSDGGYYSD